MSSLASTSAARLTCPSAACRSFSTSVVRSKAAKKASSVKSPRAKKGAAVETGVSVEEAALALKALRPSNLAWSAYELEIHTKPNVSQNVNALRGRIFPPHAVAAAGKKRDTIVVFAEEKEGQAAKDAGADVVGGAALATQILEGQVVPTKLIAHPSMMSLFTPQMARFLGPKGLMPSERRGTVTTDLASAVKAAVGGLDWKADDKGCVRSPIGRLHMDHAKLQENIRMLVREVSDLAGGSAGQSASAVAASAFSIGASGAQNPEAKRKAAVKKVLLSATQGPSFELSGVVE